MTSNSCLIPYDRASDHGVLPSRLKIALRVGTTNIHLLDFLALLINSALRSLLDRRRGVSSRAPVAGRLWISLLGRMIVSSLVLVLRSRGLFIGRDVA